MDRAEYMRSYRQKKRETPAISKKLLSSEPVVPAPAKPRGRPKKQATDDSHVRAIQMMSQDRRDEILKRINKSQSHDR